MKIGQVIREYRRKKGMTMEELGKEIGVTAAAISRYELGQRSLDANSLQMIATVLNIPYKAMEDALIEGLTNGLLSEMECEALTENMLLLTKGAKKISAFETIAEFGGYAFDFENMTISGKKGTWKMSEKDFVDALNESVDYIAYRCMILEKKSIAACSACPAEDPRPAEQDPTGQK